MIKHFLKTILWYLHLDLTRNQQYDRQTLKIIYRFLHPESHCIDVGCHKGEMLDPIIRVSPTGPHWAFEPLPLYYRLLCDKYKNLNINILPFALSDEKKTVTFNHIVNAPAFSGLKERKYHCANPDIEKIQVETECLDHLIPENIKIDFIKIDVEGGEYGVLKGAARLLARHNPLVVFEFGLGAADYYGTDAPMMYDLLASCGMKISLMKDFLQGKPSLSKESFTLQFIKGVNYYFLAHP